MKDKFKIFISQTGLLCIRIEMNNESLLTEFVASVIIRKKRYI